MSGKDVVGSAMFSSFLKGYGKTKVPKRILKSTQLKRKYGFGYEKRKYQLWLESHPTHKRLLSLGGVFGGLAAYANWGRGKKQ